MAATIVVKRIDATLENGVWRCRDVRLRQYLEAVLKECQRLEGSTASDDRLALLVSNRVGGAVIPSVMPAAPVSPPPGGPTFLPFRLPP